MGVNYFPNGVFWKEDPIKMPAYTNHFMKPTDYSTNDWTVTNTGAGTEAIANTKNGELVLTNAAADNDLISIQLQKETFGFTSNRRFFYRVRLKLSDATQSDMLAGIVITDTTPLSNSDGVYFRKDDGDTNIDFVVNKDSTASTASAIGTMADDTYIELAFAYDGVNSLIKYWVDGGTDSGEPNGELATTNLPDDEALTVTFFVQNGEAVAKILTIDWVDVRQDIA